MFLRKHFSGKWLQGLVWEENWLKDCVKLPYRLRVFSFCTGSSFYWINWCLICPTNYTIWLFEFRLLHFPKILKLTALTMKECYIIWLLCNLIIFCTYMFQRKIFSTELNSSVRHRWNKCGWNHICHLEMGASNHCELFDVENWPGDSCRLSHHRNLCRRSKVRLGEMRRGKACQRKTGFSEGGEASFHEMSREIQSRQNSIILSAFKIRHFTVTI